jgi:hypothetical protein
MGNVISRLPPANCLAIDGFAFETKPLLIVLRRDNSPSQAVARSLQVLEQAFRFELHDGFNSSADNEWRWT